MVSDRGGPARRTLVALAGAAALVLSGPYVGEARAWLRATLTGGTYVLVLNAIVLGVAIASLVSAIVRSRSRYSLLFSLAGIAVAVVGARIFADAAANANQSAVERFHFVEYGVVTWLFYRAAIARAGAGDMDRTIDSSVVLLPAIGALLVSVADEWFQWFVPERIGEWPDILLNANAIAGGLLFSLGMWTPHRISLQLTPRSRHFVSLGAAALVLAGTAFVHTIHVGHRIDAGAVGTFRSRYTSAQLDALMAERRRQWQSAPPPQSIDRMSREDQYLAEAAWHVQARNNAWDADVPTAWGENRILERFYAPAIDTPSSVMPISRWSPAHRADAERRMHERGPLPPFESHAERLRLYVVSPWAIWIPGSALALALLLWGRRRTTVPDVLSRVP